MLSLKRRVLPLLLGRCPGNRIGQTGYLRRFQLLASLDWIIR